MNYFEWYYIVFLYFPIFLYMFLWLVSLDLKYSMLNDKSIKRIKKQKLMHKIVNELLAIIFCFIPLINFTVFLNILLNYNQTQKKVIEKQIEDGYYIRK